MRQMNLIGNLAADCKTNEQGIVYFTLAVDMGKDESGNKKPPMWVNIYNAPKSLVPFLKKGLKVYVSGQFVMKTYLYRRPDGTEETLIDTTLFSPLIQLIQSATNKENQP